MRKMQIRIIPALLLIGVCFLCSCGKEEILFPYNQEENGYQQYNGMELTKRNGNILSAQADYSEEAESETENEPVSEPEVLFAQYYEFSDGTEGFIGQLPTTDSYELPLSVTERGYTRLSPGGLTKFLTADVALDLCNENSDYEIVYHAQMIEGIENMSRAYLNDNVQLTFRQLMLAMFALDANDAASALVQGMGITKDDFVEKMNEKAGDFGAAASCFTNGTGASDEEQYTTIYDMYLIISHSLLSDEVYEAFQSLGEEGEYASADGEIIYNYEWYCENEIQNGFFEINDFTTLGGFVTVGTDSGYSLVYYFTDNFGTRYVAIIMNAPGYEAGYNNLRQLVEETMQ